MSNIILFQFPGACSRVTMTALEEIGLDYEDRFVDLRTDAQKKPDYLKLNPKGKVPALSVDGRVRTENAVILYFLHQQYPQAGLLPTADGRIDNQQGLSDLVWCSSTIHPIVRQVRAPMKWTLGEVDGVEADGIEKFRKECAMLSERFSKGGWWYGDAWSIVDVYLCWAYRTCEGAGFPLDDYPAVRDHDRRLSKRASVQRALAREKASMEAAG